MSNLLGTIYFFYTDTPGEWRAQAHSGPADRVRMDRAAAVLSVDEDGTTTVIKNRTGGPDAASVLAALIYEAKGDE